MTLVDTSKWIDHLKKTDSSLSKLLQVGQVLSHPFVIGEMAMGSFRNREELLHTLSNLQRPAIAKDDEVLHFVSQNKLHGLGIGYIDAHLLASVQLTRKARLWTSDKRLLKAAEALGLAFHS